MDERPRVVTLRGNPMTLVGPALKVGDRAPDFTVVDGALNTVTLKDFAGQRKLISVVPSLDTPICEQQTKRFHAEAEKLPPGTVLITVSMDLPFAQQRFCTTQGLERLRVLSDYREASFGQSWGVLIKEVRLLARAVFVLDAQDVIRHVQIVPEVSEHPDYEAALAAVR
ncbi:MAG: thiol peroxidase [Deferrisomatales bacterium]